MLKLCHNYNPYVFLLNIYNSLILPYLQSGIEFWGSKFKTYLDTLCILQEKV